MADYKKCYNRIEEAKEIYQQHSSLIQKNNCYYNVWQLLTNTLLFHSHPGWKIAFGYVRTRCIECPIYIRHCFILDTEQNDVIDASIAEGKCKEEYYIVEAYSAKEYLHLCTKYKTADLAKFSKLERAFREFAQWGAVNNIYCYDGSLG